MPNDAFKKQKTIEDVLYYWENYASKIKVLERQNIHSVFKDYQLNGFIDLLYETEDGNLGILDYKNAYVVNDYKIEKYATNLYLSFSFI